MWEYVKTIRENAIRENARGGALTGGEKLVERLENQCSSPAEKAGEHEHENKHEHEADDIKLLQGSQGVYFISELYMTKEYASILIRMEEGDNPALIADMVRKDCQKYPRPTDVRVFYKFPFFMDKEELNQVLEAMASHPAYQDIKSVTAFTGVTYLYSTSHMREKYAAKLADKLEYKLKYGH